MLGLARNQVLLVQDGLVLRVVQPQRGVDLALAFDGLLVELDVQPLSRSKVDWKRSPTWKSMLMAPMVSALAVRRSLLPLASKCRTAVPAGNTRQSTV
jgi:hypothetical protein